MTLLITIASFLCIGGGFLMIGLSPFEFLEGLSKWIKPKDNSLKSRIRESKNQKQPKGVKRLVLEVQAVLRITGRQEKFSMLCVLSMLLVVVGVLLALSMKNVFLVPVLAAGFPLLPFYYVMFTASRQKKQINGELETALSMITSSYMRNKNTFLRAVEENMPYLNPPVSEVFRDFLMESKLIHSNLKEALEKLKLTIDSDVFQEWVEAVIACQDDHNLKSTLSPIKGKLSDMRVVSAELDLLIYEPVKEYITMVILVLGSIPLLYFLNQEWYRTLMFTAFGKMLLAISGGMIFLSIAAVVKHTRPVEYKR